MPAKYQEIINHIAKNTARVIYITENINAIICVEMSEDCVLFSSRTLGLDYNDEYTYKELSELQNLIQS